MQYTTMKAGNIKLPNLELAHRQFQAFFVGYGSFRTTLIVLLWLLAGVDAAFAQNQPTAASATSQKNPGPRAASSTAQKSSSEALLFTFALTPEKAEYATDTLPDYHFRVYNPARRQLIDFGTLGNLGSSARPLLFDLNPRRGLDLGLHAFDVYLLHPSNLRFYRNTRSFSEAYFTQGKNNLETQFEGRFSRTFSDGVNFSLEYRSINNLGQYTYQRDRHNALTAGLWIPLGKRYETFLIFSKNVMRQRENGGIVTDTVFAGAQFQGPLAAAVWLPEERAYTRFDDQRINLTQHYRLAGKQGARALRASHTFEWSQIKYKFSDGDSIEGLGNDAAYYNRFLINKRGLRHFVALDRYDNTFTINTFKSKKDGSPSDLLALGIAHSYIRLNQEPSRYAYNNLFLTGDLQFTPSKRFNLIAHASLGILDNIGEYQLRGSLKLGLGKAGEFRAGLLSQRRPPDILYQRLFISRTPIWNLNLEKPVENTLSASYALPLIGFDATAKTTLINNYLYYDQDGFASQTAASLQIVQLLITENLKWGWLRFDNTFALQQSNRSDVFRLPNWFSKNSLYLSGKLFKKRLLLNVGVDFRMNSAFQPDGYQPLTGQFYLQDTITQQPYPWVDLFLAFKVQDFRFFFRYENAYTWLDNTQVFYQTARYAQPFGALRLGVAWRFMDDNVKSAPAQAPGSAPSAPGSSTGGGIKGGKN